MGVGSETEDVESAEQDRMSPSEFEDLARQAIAGGYMVCMEEVRAGSGGDGG